AARRRTGRRPPCSMPWARCPPATTTIPRGHRGPTTRTATASLEERHPTPALLPADPFDRARVRELQGVIGCDVHPLQNLRVLETLRRELGQDDAGVEAWCRRWIAEGFAAF